MMERLAQDAVIEKYAVDDGLDEDALGMYVALGMDGVDRPLAAYSEREVQEAGGTVEEWLAGMITAKSFSLVDPAP